MVASRRQRDAATLKVMRIRVRKAARCTGGHAASEVNGGPRHQRLPSPHHAPRWRQSGAGSRAGMLVRPGTTVLAGIPSSCL